MYKILLAIVLFGFLDMTAYVLYSYGIFGWIPQIWANPVTILLTVDLVIALGIGCGWMISDAKKRGVSALPYLLLTASTGSAGLLLYVLRRPAER